MKTNNALTRPLVRSRLHEAIVTLLQKQILSGAIAPGEKLPPERDLAESLQVNRATVREALRKLESLDLVEIRHGDGVFARNYLESSNLELILVAIELDERHAALLEVMEARRHLVPEIASLAAQRRTAADLEALETIVLDDSMTMLERDLKLHQAVARCSHNLLYTISLNYFSKILRDYGHLYFADERHVSRSQRFHREIFEAIKAQQPDEARQIMLDVLIYAEDAMRASLALASKHSI